MKKIKRFFSLIAILLPFLTYAQGGMAINTTSSPAASSAMLDVSSTSKGVLVPRMTTAQKNAISSPSTGLLVYQTDGTTGFYYYNGSAWTAIAGSGSGSVTSVSSGNLSPVFTSTVTSSTTTPSILYSLNNATAHSFLGNNTGSSAAPAYTTVGPQDLTNSGGTASSTTFYRGDGQWINPTAFGNIRTVTSSTTLVATDQIVIANSASLISLTLFSPSLVPKGYELTLIKTGSCGSAGCLVFCPSGVTQVSSCGGPTIGGFNYTATLVGDGVSTWYWKVGQ